MPSPIVISDYREETGSSRSTGATEIERQSEHRAVVHERSGRQEGKYVVLGPNELYPFAEVSDATLFQAIQLTGECISSLGETLGFDPNDFLSIDSKLIQVRVTLRQLFALRSIGDGFGAVVNGCLWGLKNKDTETVSRRQIAALKAVLSEVKRKPLMHFDTAMSLLDDLESVDLSPEPDTLSDLFGPVPEDEQ
ncbi:MAG TPA: hypothetical protein VMD97_01730 [Candidatus Aquilonibacter sp.]|nr:hypothetical protein [Candidatus Aquilonibacter sp.]